jgi:hypothetical protein
MAAYENNYERITSHLQFLDNKLVIPFDEVSNFQNLLSILERELRK